MVVNSISSFLEVLRKREDGILRLREKYDWYFRGNREVITWYRGHADESWELLPTVLRTWFRDRVDKDAPSYERDWFLIPTELRVNNTFRRMGLSLLPERADLIDIYFLAQHFGMPTRLLDWSTNALTSLFFAVVSCPDKNGAVYLLDPMWPIGVIGIDSWPPDTPAIKGFPTGPFDIRYRLIRETIEFLFGERNEPSKPESVVPVLPDLHAGRMLQQASCFTLHMPGAIPIQQPFVERVKIPKERKSEILTNLRHLGITWATLFPDLDHLSMEIRSAMNLNP